MLWLIGVALIVLIPMLAGLVVWQQVRHESRQLYPEPGIRPEDHH